MRVTLPRAGTAVGARATARAKGRRARGRAVGMMRHGADRERGRAAARLTVRDGASLGARSAPAGEGAGPSERRAGEAVGVLDESR